MPETLADLLRSVGVQPSAREQFVESTRRPDYVVPRPRPRTMRDPEERMRDPNAGVRNQAREQQRAAYAAAQSQGALQSRLARSEAYDPGIDPVTGLTQGQEAILGAAEFTGAPSAFRSYDAFANDRPWEGVGHAGLGALAVLGNAGVGASPRVSPRPQLPMRGALSDAPTRLPVNPSRNIAPNGLPIRPSEPFRNSLRGGSDDLREAAGLDARARGGESLGPVARHQFTGPRGQAYEVVISPDNNAGVAAVSFARVRDDGFAPRYRPHNDLTPGEARSVYREVARIVREDAAQHGRSAYGARGYTGRQTGLYQALAEGDPMPGYARDATDANSLIWRREASPSSGAEQTGRAAQASVPDGGARGGEQTLDLGRLREEGWDTSQTWTRVVPDNATDPWDVRPLGRFGPGLYFGDATVEGQMTSRVNRRGAREGYSAATHRAYIRDGEMATEREWREAFQRHSKGALRERDPRDAEQRAVRELEQRGFIGVVVRDRNDGSMSLNVFRRENILPVPQLPTASSGPPKPQQTKRNRPRPKPGFFMPGA